MKTENAEHISQVDARDEAEREDPKRNGFGALMYIPEWVGTLVSEAEAAGVYTTGIDGDAKSWVAVNTDVYGYDRSQSLVVVQVRESRCTKWGRQTRKDYYLLGRLESGAVFAHPVVSPRTSPRAMASPLATVRFCLTRVWNCRDDDLEDIVRQGDVALVPQGRLPEGVEALTENEMVVAGSHRLRAESIYRRGHEIYAKGRMTIVHLRHEHATVRVRGGIRRVVAGYRAPTWGFTAPSAD